MFKLFFALVTTGPRSGQQYIVKPGSKLMIGRVPEANLRLDSDLYCSRKHALLYWEKDLCFIEDLQSTNGTFVNNSKIEGKKELRDGDLVATGDTQMVIGIKDYSGMLPKGTH